MPAEAFLLIGPTGAGKTPLGMLIDELGLWGRPCRHFDFGERLRRAAAADRPPDGLAAADVAVIREVLRTGALLEDHQFPIARALLEAFIRSPAPDRPWRTGEQEGILLNGLPRHVGQAEDVAAIVTVRAVIHLDCPPDVVAARIRANTGGDRAGRDDDDREAVQQRLDLFNRRIGPLVEHYRWAGVPVAVVRVTADATPGAMWKDLNARSVGDRLSDERHDVL